MDIQLTTKQKEAVVSDNKRIAVIAGPGSGKTRVLTERICYLVNEKAVPKNNILALTFTNKAANEMKKRVINELGKDYMDMNIMTFHKLGLKIIRENIDLFSFGDDLEIADNTTIYNIVREIMCENEASDYEISDIVHGISMYKNGMNIEKPLFFEEYNLKMSEKGLIDLDDLIYRTVELLENNDLIRRLYLSRYKYVLIDEYQDINKQQDKLISLITDEYTNLFIVGDDDQCIYEWRGSTPDLLAKYVNSNDVDVIRLQDNFRSGEAIVNISDNFINKNLKRIKKKLFSKKKKENKVNQTQAIFYERHGSAHLEGEAIARHILELQEEKYHNYNSFSILVRSHKQIKPISDALSSAGIPHSVHSMDSANFNSFVCVLLAVDNPNFNRILMPAVNFPNRVLGSIGYKKLCESNNWNSLNTKQIFDEMCSTQEEFRNKSFFTERYRLICKLASQKDELSVVDIINKLVDFYKNEPYLENEEKRLNIELAEQLLGIAKQYLDENGKVPLREFLDYVQFMLQDDKETNVDNEKVNIMTCHRAKGLEFPVVFIPGVQVGVFPNDYFVKSESDLEQERRLFYVTMTRAIDKLFISCYDDPLYVPSNDIIKHSFLAELGKFN